MPLTRRTFLAAAATLPLLSGCSKAANRSWKIPDEGAPHTRTWMAFGASEEIWGAELLPQVQEDLATIALTIAEFEPVTMLVRPAEMELATKLLDNSVELIEAPLDDLWMRDTGPIFVVDEKGEAAGVDLNFNGWGGKQKHSRDAKLAGFIAKKAGVPRVSAGLVLEGGCIEFDGEGTAILTESCSLNKNRNPGMSKHQMEAELKRLFGLKKIIWLPGVAGQDITDGHTDFYARFVEPGHVVAGFEPDTNSSEYEITLEHIEILKASKDAEGRALKVEILEAPYLENVAQDFAAGYIGYYLCNGGVICQAFGDAEADLEAKSKLETLFPQREVIQIRIDAIAAGGGSVHCATQQQPRIL